MMDSFQWVNTEIQDGASKSFITIFFLLFFFIRKLIPCVEKTFKLHRTLSIHSPFLLAPPLVSQTGIQVPWGAGEGFREEVTFGNRFWGVSWSLCTAKLLLLMAALWRKVMQDEKGSLSELRRAIDQDLAMPFLAWGPCWRGAVLQLENWRFPASAGEYRCEAGSGGRAAGGVAGGKTGYIQMAKYSSQNPSVSAEKKRRKKKHEKGSKPTQPASQSLLGKCCWEPTAGDMSAPDGNLGWQAPFFKLSACLPDRIWIEWLAFLKPRLIGLKEKKCYFSSHKTTKRNGETKILFRLNKLQGDSLGSFQGVRWRKALKYHSIKLNF